MSLSKIVIACTAVILLAGTAAKADIIDFNCNTSGSEVCAGTVVKSATTYTGTDLSIFDQTGPYLYSVPFDLSFTLDTETVVVPVIGPIVVITGGTISIDGTGAYSGQDFSGDVISGSVNKSGPNTGFDFGVDWTVVPSGLGTPIGGNAGIGTISLVESSSDISISTVPEPASFMLLGGGLLAFVGILRRKQRVN